MSDEFQFIFIGAIDTFHHGSESAATGVRGVGMDLGAVYFVGRVIESAGIEDGVELSSILFDTKGLAVFLTEHGAGNFIVRQAVNDRLDGRGDGDYAVFTCIGFRAACKGSFFPVIKACIEGDKLGRPEAQVALAEDVIGVRYFIHIFTDDFDIIIWEGNFRAMFAREDQVRRQVKFRKMARDSELI